MVAWYDTEMTIDQILTALAEQPKEIGALLPRICRELECTFPRAAASGPSTMYFPSGSRTTIDPT